MEQLKKVISVLGKTLWFKISLPLVGILLLMGVTAFTTVRLVRDYPDFLGLAKGPKVLQQEEDDFITEVGESITLPEDERPIIARVTNLERLQGQAFFKNAQEEDKVLIYPNSRKVVLYRPGEKRVIEVGTVNIDDQKAEVAGIASGASFVLLNGTETAGLTQTFEDELKAALPDAEVVIKADAINAGYEKTLLVDLAGDKADEAEELAERLGLEVGAFPDDEERPEEGDFLIIVGSDRASNAL